jgi:hypothetical protein
MAKSQFRQWLDQKERIRERKKLIRQAASHDHKVTLRQVLIRYFQSKIKIAPEKEATQDEALNMLQRSNVTHVAIVLNGVVQDVIRAQDRMAALLLGQPQFVEFNPNEIYPILGTSTYKDGKFENYYVKEKVLTMPIVDDSDIFEYLDEEDREAMEKLRKEENV